MLAALQVADARAGQYGPGRGWGRFGMRNPYGPRWNPPPSWCPWTQAGQAPGDQDPASLDEVPPGTVVEKGEEPRTFRKYVGQPAQDAFRDLMLDLEATIQDAWPETDSRNLWGRKLKTAQDLAEDLLPAGDPDLAGVRDTFNALFSGWFSKGSQVEWRTVAITSLHDVRRLVLDKWRRRRNVLTVAGFVTAAGLLVVGGIVTAIIWR